MDEIEKEFMTQGKFTSLVETLVKESGGLLNYIEAVTTVCEEYEIEIEIVNKLISRPLKDKIKWDAQKLNYVKRTTLSLIHI